MKPYRTAGKKSIHTRVIPELAQSIAEEAAKDGRSVSALIAHILQQWIDARGREHSHD